MKGIDDTPVYETQANLEGYLYMLVESLKELFKFKDLVWVWCSREIRVRYKQSLLGAIWAILQPLSMMIVFTLVFSRLARIPTDGIPYPIFSYSAVLPWTLFSGAISFGVPSLVNNLNLVVRTYFPREVLPIGAVGASLFDFIVGSSIFAIMLIYYHVPITPAIIWVPLIIVFQLMLMLGIIFIGSAIIVRYRDVRFIVPLGLQIWLYATPVIYPISLVPERYRPIYMLNPMAGFINSYREILLYGHSPVWNYLAISAIVALFVFIIGYIVFKRLEVTFADLI